MIEDKVDDNLDVLGYKGIVVTPENYHEMKKKYPWIDSPDAGYFYAPLPDAGYFYAPYIPSFAESIVGVQPMTKNTGLIFTLHLRSPERAFDEAMKVLKELE